MNHSNINGAKFYLHEQGLISGNEQRDELLAEGVAYLLYAKAGMPNDEQISLQGLPFTYKDNADFVKEVYVQAEMLAQEIEDSYRNKQNEITVIDDTEEETVSDEPIVSVEQTEHIHEGQTQVEELSQPEYYPLYKRYMEVQKTKPDAIVLIKNGDFYEVLGENAETISKETNLTLTGRDVGLDERVPMCGIPQHFLDEFLNKILEKHGALLVESDDEPMYVLSHAEALEQSAEAEEKVKPELVEIADEEPSPFDDEQSESDDDWRSELAEELGELADEQLEDEAEEAEIDEDEEFDETDSSSDEQDEDEVSEKYSVKLCNQDGEEVPIEGKVTVRLLIPEAFRNKDFDLMALAKSGAASAASTSGIMLASAPIGTAGPTSVKFTRDGNYVVFETDGLSEYVFTSSYTPYLPILIIATGVLLADVAAMIVLTVVIKKKRSTKVR